MNKARARKLTSRAKQIAIQQGFPQEAEDFSQDVIVKILNGRKARLDHLLVDYLRESYSRTQDVYHARQVRETDLIQKPELFSAFNAILAECEERTRCILILKYVWGFKTEEIAHCLGISEGRVSQVLKEGLVAITRLIRN